MGTVSHNSSPLEPSLSDNDDIVVVDVVDVVVDEVVVDVVVDEVVVDVVVDEVVLVVDLLVVDGIDVEIDCVVETFDLRVVVEFVVVVDSVIDLIVVAVDSYANFEFDVAGDSSKDFVDESFSLIVETVEKDEYVDSVLFSLRSLSFLILFV